MGRLEFNPNKEFTATFECTSIDKDVIAQMIEPATEIVFAHPKDLEQIDLDRIYNYVWFFADSRCERGQMIVIKDKLMKIDFIKNSFENPNIVKKGRLFYESR